MQAGEGSLWKGSGVANSRISVNSGTSETPSTSQTGEKNEQGSIQFPLRLAYLVSSPAE